MADNTTLNTILAKAEADAKMHLGSTIDNINKALDKSGKLDPEALRKSQETLALLQKDQKLIDQSKLQQKINAEKEEQQKRALAAKNKTGVDNATTGETSSGVSETV